MSLFRFSPTHIQLTRTNLNGSFKISLSLLNKSNNHSSLAQTSDYIKQYTFYNPYSNYKSWFELNNKEQCNFIDNYIKFHDTQKNKPISPSLQKQVSIWDHQNKDVNLLFANLYNYLKENADAESNSFKDSKDEVVRYIDDSFELLYKK